MAKPSTGGNDHPAADAVVVIPKPQPWQNKPLQHAVGMFNAMVENGLLHLFPAVFPASAARAVLVQAIQADEARGQAHSAVTYSVEERRAIEDEAATVGSRVRSILDGGLPIGTPGRADYFPTETVNPSEGDLLISYGKGTKKNQWPTLPNQWTADYLIDLGTRWNKARAQADSSKEGRKGHARASKSVQRDVAALRTRMRQMLTGWFGVASTELLKFGLQPRKPSPGRRPRKDKTVARAPVASTDGL